MKIVRGLLFTVIALSFVTSKAHAQTEDQYNKIAARIASGQHAELADDLNQGANVNPSSVYEPYIYLNAVRHTKLQAALNQLMFKAGCNTRQTCDMVMTQWDIQIGNKREEIQNDEVAIVLLNHKANINQKGPSGVSAQQEAGSWIKDQQAIALERTKNADSKAAANKEANQERDCTTHNKYGNGPRPR